MIQMAGSLWTPVITTGSLLQPPREELEEEELEEEGCNDLKPLPLNSERLPDRLIYWTPHLLVYRGNVIPPVYRY